MEQFVVSMSCLLFKFFHHHTIIPGVFHSSPGSGPRDSSVQRPPDRPSSSLYHVISITHTSKNIYLNDKLVDPLFHLLSTPGAGNKFWMVEPREGNENYYLVSIFEFITPGGPRRSHFNLSINDIVVCKAPTKKSWYGVSKDNVDRPRVSIVTRCAFFQINFYFLLQLSHSVSQSVNDSFILLVNQNNPFPSRRHTQRVADSCLHWARVSLHVQFNIPIRDFSAVQVSCCFNPQIFN